MTHVRTQIRKAFETELQGLPTSQSRVYVTRVYNIQKDKLPALFIYTDSEDISFVTKKTPTSRRLDRILRVVVEAAVEGIDETEDTVDTMILEVEQALADNILGGLVKKIELSSITTNKQDGGEKPISGAMMVFNVQYQTLANNAGSAA